MKSEEEIYAELRVLAERMKTNKFEVRQDQERWEALLWALDFPLIPVLVDKLMRALLVGRIQNECSIGEQITTEQQTEFWDENKDTMKMYLFLDPVNLLPVGFCGATIQDEKMWLTSAILPTCRGRGYGREMVRFFIRMVDYDCWATVERDNPTALELHPTGDWEYWMSDEKLFHIHTWRGRK
jgi:hypothetical protein